MPPLLSTKYMGEAINNIFCKFANSLEPVVQLLRLGPARQHEAEVCVAVVYRWPAYWLSERSHIQLMRIEICSIICRYNSIASTPGPTEWFPTSRGLKILYCGDRRRVDAN